jgi:hypothetical protein
MCCTGNELLMRHGIPLAGSFFDQELVIATGAIEAMVIDYCSVLFCRLLKGCGCGVKMMEGLHRHIEYYPGQGIYGPGITTHGRGVRGPYPKTSGLLLLLGLITLNILLLQVAGLRSSSLAGLATFRKRRFFRHPLPQLH